MHIWWQQQYKQHEHEEDVIINSIHNKNKTRITHTKKY